jgi:hypothetical protein
MGRKTNISNYDNFKFAEAQRISMKNETEAYKAGDYLSYIKHCCLSMFFAFSNSAFMYKTENQLFPNIEPFSCYQFPTIGRGHDFQAFKKLGFIEKIPAFNESHARLYSILKPDWFQVQKIMTEHHARWRAMPASEKIDLIEKLSRIYQKNEDVLGSDSRLYELCFIYENQYLHGRFERFMSTKDIYEWWDNEALEILQ